MKENIQIGIILLGTLGLFSCENFLSKAPDNRTQLDSPSAVSELLVSAYPDEAYIAFTETMSDNAGDKGIGQYVSEYIPNQKAYFWEDDLSTEDSPTAYWNGCYKAISHSNQALRAIEESGNPQDYTAQRGEALATRAYAHFMLVNLFAKPYNPVTAAEDPGVPYVTEPEDVVFRQYERATVQTVFDSVRADMEMALKLVRDDYYVVPKYHFTRDALCAFATRYYLYTGEWDKVIAYGREVLGDRPAAKLRDWNGKYMTLEASELWAQYTRSEESANLLLNRAYTVWARGLVVFRYSLSPDKVIELFELGNIGLKRFDLVIGDKVLQAGGSDQCSFIPKYPDRMEIISGNLGYVNTIVPLFTTEEVLFNLAEAYVMKGEYDRALDCLDAYNQKRNQSYLPANKIDEAAIGQLYKDGYEPGPDLSPFYSVDGRQQLYLWYLLDLRRREFIHEGLRWFDIRRFNFEIEHTIFGGSPVSLPKSDLRRVIQIPSQAIAAGLAPNPR